MALARKLAYNVVFNAFAKVASTALALVAIGFVTRYLGKEGFGNYATVLAFFGFFNAVADLGLQTVGAREISREGADEKRILGTLLTLRILTATLVLLATPILLFFLPYSGQVKFGILIAAAAFVFSSTSMVLNGIFQKHLMTDRVAIVELIGKVIQLGVIICAVTLDLGFIAIVLSLLLYMLFNAVTVFWISRKYVDFTLHIDRAYWKEFLRQSLPIGIASLITFTYFKMDTILLSVMRPSAEVGIYNVAYKVTENLIFFPAMIAGLVLPLLSRFIFTEREKFEIIANKTLKVFLVFTLPLVIGGFFLASQIVTIIGGPQFAESADVLRILIFSLAFIFFGYFFNTLLVVANLQKKLMLALGIAAIVNVSSNFFLIPRYSYMGAAVSSVATEMLVAILSCSLVIRHTFYRPRIERLGSILASGIILALFLAFSPALPLIVTLLCGATLYLGSLWISRAIENDEIASLVKESKGVPAEAVSPIE